MDVLLLIRFGALDDISMFKYYDYMCHHNSVVSDPWISGQFVNAFTGVKWMIDHEELMSGLSSSMEFLSAVQSLKDQLEREPKTPILAIALSMFTMGYSSCMEFNEKKDKMRPLNLKSYKEKSEPDIQSNQDQVDVDRCQHESDGQVWRKSWSEDDVWDRCKKCGEFYR